MQLVGVLASWGPISKASHDPELASHATARERNCSGKGLTGSAGTLSLWYVHEDY